MEEQDDGRHRTTATTSNYYFLVDYSYYRYTLLDRRNLETL